MASQENLSGNASQEVFRDPIPSHQAAASNDISELSRLVEERAELIDPLTKETPLHAAAKLGSLDTLKWILENKVAKLESRSNTGNTAAHLAAVWGHLPCMKHLLTYDEVMGKALSEMGEDGGLTVLSLATLQGDEDMAIWLIENFPNSVYVPNNNGDQVVHFAAAEGQLNILKKIIEDFGNEIASVEDTRSTKPVFFAAQQGRVEILDYLINEVGVDPLAKDNMGMSTIHAATQNQMFEAVKWLIEKLGKQNVVEKTSDGATPLHLAAASGNTKILKYLLENLEDPADINVTDRINATPAHDAAEYGKAATMLILLQHGADINIPDTDDKTPYEIALEEGKKGHLEVAAMLADYRDNGPSSLPLYEKKILRNGKGPTKENGPRPRTSQQEAEELSTVIQKSAEIVDRNKEKMLKRQESLQKMNEVGLEDAGEKDEELKQKDTAEDLRQTETDQPDLEEANIDHAQGPDGDFYALPKKKKYQGQKVKKGKGRRSHQNSDVEDYMSETMSHQSYGQHYPSHAPPLGSPPLLGGDPTYATVNHETTSNYSRPSRVKRYQDTDSDISGLTGRSDYLYDNRIRPGFYPPGYGPGGPGFAPNMPGMPGMPGMPIPPRGPLPPRPMSGSSKGSGSQYGVPPSQFRYNAPMYMGYPAMYQGYPPQAGQMMGLPPQHQLMQGYGPNGQMAMFIARPVQMRKYYEAKHEASRRKSLGRKKKKKKQPSIDGSLPPQQRKRHTDENIGYGPSLEGGNIQPDSTYDDNFHPPAPPITTNRGVEDSTDVLKFDSNFIMTKPGENVAVRQHGGTKLNPTKSKPIPYDGRYDKYIMTDSEEEYEVDDQHRVGFAAEVACIIAIGCVAGLRGLTKMKKGSSAAISKPPEQKSPENPSISTAWDVSYDEVISPKKKGKRSRRNSVSGPVSQLSPDEYVGQEESDRPNWNKEGKKKKSKSEDKEKKKKKKPAEAEDIQTGLVTQDLVKQSYQSVSKSLGEKILGETIGARNSSMVNMMMASGFGSRMSLASNHDDDNDDDDNFDDTISILHGQDPSKKEKLFDLPKPSGEEQLEVVQSSDDKPKKKKKDKKKSEEREKKKKEKKKKNRSESESEVIENNTATLVDDSQDRQEAKLEQQGNKVMGDGGKKEDGSTVIENSGASSVDAHPREGGDSKEVESQKKDDSVSLHSKSGKTNKTNGKGKTEEQLQHQKEEMEKKEREKKEREDKKEKERREKEEKKEKERLEREEKKERERREKDEKKERERKEKEEKKERLKKEKEEREKERKEKEERDRENRERLKKEKEERDRERKEREKAEKEERDKKKKEMEEIQRKQKEKEKQEREEMREAARREKEEREKEERNRREEEMKKKEEEMKKKEEERQQMEKQRKEEEERQKMEEAQKKEEAVMHATPARPAPPPPVSNQAPSERPMSATSMTSGNVSVKEMDNTAIHMFDTESEDEEDLETPAPAAQPQPKPKAAVSETDEIEMSVKNMASDLGDFIATQQQSLPTTNALPSSKPAQSTRPRGEERRQATTYPHAEESRQKTNLVEGDSVSGGERNYADMMQFGFPDISALADEMHNFYEEEDLEFTYIEGSTPSLDQASMEGFTGQDDDGLVLMTDFREPQLSSPNKNVGRADAGTGMTIGNSVAVGSGGGTRMVDANTQKTSQLQSINIQGSASYSSSFEQSVLSILQNMSEKMKQLKSNPSATQSEIQQQEKAQNDMIQNMITMSQRDPQLTYTLISLLEKQNMSSVRNSTAFEELQSKLLLAQEEQRKASRQQYQSQMEFQQSIQKKLEEQAQQQMMGLQSNFEKYAKQMEERWEQQQKRLEEEIRKRKEAEEKAKKKSHKKGGRKAVRRHGGVKAEAPYSDISSSESDEGLVLAIATEKVTKETKPRVGFHPALMAQIRSQSLLNDDDLRTDSQISVEKIQEKQQARGKILRKNTSVRLGDTEEAMRQFSMQNQNGIQDDDDDEEGELQFQHAQHTGFKVAQIKVQSGGTGYTPVRPEGNPVRPQGNPVRPLGSSGKIGQIRRIE